MKWTKLLDKIPTVVKVVSLLVFIAIVAAALLSSEYSVRWMARRMADVSKTITNTYKTRGLDAATVEGKVKLGILEFTVIGKEVQQ